VSPNYQKTTVKTTVFVPAPIARKRANDDDADDYWGKIARYEDEAYEDEDEMDE